MGDFGWLPSLPKKKPTELPPILRAPHQRTPQEQTDEDDSIGHDSEDRTNSGSSFPSSAGSVAFSSLDDSEVSPSSSSCAAALSRRPSFAQYPDSFLVPRPPTLSIPSSRCATPQALISPCGGLTLVRQTPDGPPPDFLTFTASSASFMSSSARKSPRPPGSSNLRSSATIREGLHYTRSQSMGGGDEIAAELPLENVQPNRNRVLQFRTKKKRPHNV
eukprot:NODE_2416_length_1425_cov_160.238863_g2298_i0.p1 GENE.NODE_2416_length_1425_cov_160.238863_g2298_i0~~NODE_2416_length_1425_cov_160.238863_g2298_i0.p1  ORF type:complete len:242 (+),score=31.92 NODE_2416_length_1425_cov_160.238863_g2298_i0:73-726(+)